MNKYTIEDLVEFTNLFHKIRPRADKDLVAIEVEDYKQGDRNVVFKVAKLVNDAVVSDPETIILSSEWIVENVLSNPISRKLQEDN